MRARRLARGLHQTLWGIHTPRPAPQQHVPRPSWKKGVGCFFYLFSSPTSPLLFCLLPCRPTRQPTPLGFSAPIQGASAASPSCGACLGGARPGGSPTRFNVGPSPRVLPPCAPPPPPVGPPSPPLALIHIAPGAWVGADARPDAGAAGAKLSHMSEGRFLGRAARLPRARLHAERGRR